MRLPTYAELARNEDQLEVLECPLDQSLFVVGPPGSGKTVLALQRAGMLADSVSAAGSDAVSPIVVVTYSRMLRRLLEQLGQNASVTASTMHSFVWHDYRRRTSTPVPRRDQYDYSWPEMLECMGGPQNAARNPHLVVDEGQDLPEGFFRYAQLIASERTVFADEDQALSEQQTTLEQIKDAAGLGDPIVLRKNHRNVPEVARLAEHFHSGRLPAAHVRRSPTGQLPSLVRTSGLASTTERIGNWLLTRGGTVGVIVDRNRTGVAVEQRLVDRLPEGVRVSRYSGLEKNESTIDLLADGVTILNKESVKGQEFDAVFILELESFIPCVSDVARRTMYMMCCRARDHLFLVYGPRALSKARESSLPSAELLERS